MQASVGAEAAFQWSGARKSARAPFISRSTARLHLGWASVQIMELISRSTSRAYSVVRRFISPTGTARNLVRFNSASTLAGASYSTFPVYLTTSVIFDASAST